MDGTNEVAAAADLTIPAKPVPAAEPAPASDVAALAKSTASTVQAAIDSHVEAYRDQIVTKIIADLEEAKANIRTGVRALGGDFVAFAKGGQVDVLDKAGQNHDIPRWAVWAGIVLSLCGIVGIVAAAGHFLHLI